MIRQASSAGRRAHSVKDEVAAWDDVAAAAAGADWFSVSEGASDVDPETLEYMRRIEELM